ncbi:MAG TPA: ATP-dependent 6-phosphofructokinase, partial [Thermoanaerobacterales bacterium]|nr:ATP-dependent 6-phosphofructokinase [Thermoanaerobacterales bacterium]
SAYDRILASRFGGKAVDLLKQNVRDKMLGLINGELVTTDIEKVFSVTKPLDMELYQLADILSY